MRVLLVEPRYYTQYPPLGLLKLSTWYKQQGHDVRFVRGPVLISNFVPDQIKVTSLFTWAWRPVWESVRFYRALFPKATISLGGVYASLTPEHAKQAGAHEVVVGIIREVEDLLPDYSLVPEWHSQRAASILFSHRGCIRSCGFCAVPKLEGKPFQVRPTTRIKHLVHPDHKRVILWDNNILGESHWRDVAAELKELALEADFNQGLDARLVTEESAQILKDLKLPTIRFAYDFTTLGPKVQRAIELLRAAGMSRHRISHICCYVLYNYKDTPEDLFVRVRDLLNWGVAAYPMRYQPLNGEYAFEKDSYISPSWSPEALEAVAVARRVVGCGGAFPPYEGLRRKFDEAGSFQEAFGLRPRRDRTRRAAAPKRERREQPLAEFAWDTDLIVMGQDHQFPVHNLSTSARVNAVTPSI
jgi:hypothetical protein